MVKLKKRSKKRIVFLSILFVLLSAILVVGGYISVCFINTGHVKLKGEAQIYQDAKTLNADISYLQNVQIFGKVSRLGYNKDAPIKVILKNNLDGKTKEIIGQAYNNFINPIMAQINDKYYFKVIEEKDFKKTNADKVIIRFESGKEPKGVASFFAPLAVTSYSLGIYINPVLTNVKITVNEFFFDEETSDERIMHIIIHEILHTFGLADVYDTENYGTILKTDIYDILYKPNDIKVLAALYFDDYDNFGKLQNWILEYSDNFYKEYSDLFLNAEIDEYEDLGAFLNMLGSIGILDIAEFNQLNLAGTREKYGYKYQFNLQNGSLYYCLTDIVSQRIIEERIGEYYFYGGKIFLGVFDIGIDGKVCKVELLIVNTENGLELVCIDLSLKRINCIEKIILQTAFEKLD